MRDAQARLMDRYKRLDEAAASVIPEPGPPASGHVCGDDCVHRRTIVLLHELFDLVSTKDGGPFATILKALRRLEPVMLRDFQTIPTSQVEGFLNELGGRMVAIGTPQPAAPDVIDVDPAGVELVDTNDAVVPRNDAVVPRNDAVVPRNDAAG